jgi:hypothetical protein
MADLGLLERFMLNKVFTRGASLQGGIYYAPTSEAIIFESITPKMVTIREGYCNHQDKTITMFDNAALEALGLVDPLGLNRRMGLGRTHKHKVFIEDYGEDDTILYLKMGDARHPGGKLYLNNFFIADDDYVIN